MTTKGTHPASVQPLAGRVAMVTGGGRGMGRAIACELARSGASVVIGARTESYGLATVEELFAQGHDASLYGGLELSDAASCRGLVEAAIDRHGRLDIVVLCAADVSLGSITDLDDDAFDTMARANLHSAFWFTKAAIPHLAKSGCGRMIYITSCSGNRVTTPVSVPYGATKAAVNALSRGAAHAYGRLGITFNCVEPGLIASDRMRETLSETDALAIAAGFPVPRPGTAEEIARVVAFLAQPESAYINGVEIPVDGGACISALSGLNDVLDAGLT